MEFFEASVAAEIAFLVDTSDCVFHGAADLGGIADNKFFHTREFLLLESGSVNYFLIRLELIDFIN